MTVIKRIALILTFLVLCASESSASWANISTEELVQDSDLIVVGTLNDVSEYSQNGIDYAQGTITVDEVIWGAAQPGEILKLKWQNESGLVCPRVEHRQNQNRKAIWLLTVQSDGVVQANHPGRFVDLAEKSEVEKSLAKNKVRLRTTSFFFSPNEPVIYRWSSETRRRPQSLFRVLKTVAVDSP